MQLKTKGLSGLKITDAGKVVAIFSRFNVKDHDGDVTLAGAFVDGAPVRISSYNHTSWGDKLPVGKGEIRVVDEHAELHGEFFLNTTAGRDTFEVVKQMGDLQEWSYGYDILDAEMGVHDGENVQFLKSLKVHEVSPVILGAGIGTRTLAVKGRDLKFSEHIGQVQTEVDALITRAQEVKTMRTQEGKNIGSASLEALTGFKSSLNRLCEVLTSEPSSDDHKAALAHELARIEVRRATEGVQ